MGDGRLSCRIFQCDYFPNRYRAKRCAAAIRQSRSGRKCRVFGPYKGRRSPPAKETSGCILSPYCRRIAAVRLIICGYRPSTAAMAAVIAWRGQIPRAVLVLGISQRLAPGLFLQVVRFGAVFLCMRGRRRVGCGRCGRRVGRAGSVGRHGAYLFRRRGICRPTTLRPACRGFQRSIATTACRTGLSGLKQAG